MFMTIRAMLHTLCRPKSLEMYNFHYIVVKFETLMIEYLALSRIPGDLQKLLKIINVDNKSLKV